MFKSRSFLFLFMSVFALFNCGGATKIRPYSAPEASSLVSLLKNRQKEAQTFKATTRMVYWLDGKRVKPTVLMMGRVGSFVRINALNPDDSVAADLACDGVNFSFQDYNNNCTLSGPCNHHAVAQLLRINLTPDEILLLAIGSTPIIGHSESSLKWDSKNAKEILTLSDPEQNLLQRITLSGKDQQWDVLESKVWRGEKSVEWSIENKDFKTISDDSGTTWRVPEKTLFQQPALKTEVEVRWNEHTLNSELPDESFQMSTEPGLPACGEKKS